VPYRTGFHSGSAYGDGKEGPTIFFEEEITMKRQRICVIALVALLATSGQALVPSSLPDIAIEVSPENPGPSDVLSVALSGIWPNSCIPEGLDVSVIEGDSIWISLLLPGWDTKGECKTEACLQVLTEWDQAITIGPLPTGDYDILVRAVACQEAGSYERLGTLQVGAGQGEPLPKNFQPGERIVLLQDNPPGGFGLKTGQAGTVICCDTLDCSGNILVSWDLWAEGKVGLGGCVNGTAAYYPPNSATWVDPSLVLVGRQFTQCGTIRAGLEGCVHFEADDGKMYNLVGSGLYLVLGSSATVGFDSRVEVQGLLNTTAPGPGAIRICPQLDGDIYHPIVSPCPEAQADCCDAEYQPGDRVVLLVDNPTGPNGQAAVSLYAGAEGTVICCSTEDAQYPIYVSWDHWNQGSDQDAPCEEPIIEHPEGSGWLMACVQIAPAREPDPNDDPPGDIVIGLGTNALQLVYVGPSPGGGYTYGGCVDLEIELNFRALISAEVTPAAGVGGNWTATVNPDIIGPGEEEVELCVQVVNLDIGNLPAGQNVQVAEITLYAQPAP
jgi:hypothetical protein